MFAVISFNIAAVLLVSYFSIAVAFLVSCKNDKISDLKDEVNELRKQEQASRDECDRLRLRVHDLRQALMIIAGSGCETRHAVGDKLCDPCFAAKTLRLDDKKG